MILLQKFGPIFKKHTWKCKRLVCDHSNVQVLIRSLNYNIAIKIKSEMQKTYLAIPICSFRLLILIIIMTLYHNHKIIKFSTQKGKHPENQTKRATAEPCIVAK